MKTTREQRQSSADAEFKYALDTGRLSQDEGASNYVGDFMYMGNHDGYAKFKHYNTREYLA